MQKVIGIVGRAHCMSLFFSSTQDRDFIRNLDFDVSHEQGLFLFQCPIGAVPRSLHS